MSSAPSSVNQVLEGYLAGRVPAAELTAVVAVEYYREAGNGKRETLQPIIDVVERAHPGIVELTGVPQRPGFEVRLADRPFPRRYEGDLRKAVEQVLKTFPSSPSPFAETRAPKPGLLKRIVAAVRKLFNA